MASVTTLNTAGVLSSDKPEAFSRWMAAGVAVVVLAHLPMLIPLAARLWAAEHYQFFPLLLLGAGYLGYHRGREADVTRGGLWEWRLLMASLAAFLLASAAVMNSTWLAAIAVMASSWMLLYFFGGAGLLARVWPAWLILWLVVPLPLNMDRELILSMQHIATQWASGVLDAMRLRHLVSGVVIELPGHEFLIEEACSGIHSFFATMACTLFLLVLSHRGWFRWALLLAAAVFWVLVANTLRVIAIVVLGSRWNLPVTEGIGHELMGALVFLMAIGLVLSTDRLFLFLLPERRYDPLYEGRSKGRRSFFKRWFGRWIGGKSRQEAAVAGKYESKISASDRSTADAATADESIRSSVRKRRRPRTQPARWETLVLIVVFGVLGVAQLIPGALSMPQGRTAQDKFIEPMAAADMPEQMGDWRRVGYETVIRSPDDPQSYISYVWTYQKDGQRVRMSLEGPYLRWHNLVGCLRGGGWRTDQARHRAYEEIGESIPGGFTELILAKELQQNAFVIFAAFDSEHRPVIPTARLFGRLAPIKEALGRPDERLAADDSIKYQLVLFQESPLPLSEAQKDDARDLFHQVRRHLSGQAIAWVEIKDILKSVQQDRAM